ncbi:MAG: hypothetical protein ACFFEN_01025 [Candidatus Thorarchaeota archaeon]
MSEDNKEENFLSIGDILNETLLRDLILFIFIFILVIAQIWEQILLLLFPLTTYAFSLFFRIINTNKWRTEFENSSIIYNPLGAEKKYANRFFFITILQLILIFWIGAESLYNPHLVDGYFLYFYVIFIFLYTFGFCWMFIDVWRYVKIEILPKELYNSANQDLDNNYQSKLLNITSALRTRNFKIIALSNFLVFVILNLVNALFSVFLTNNSVLGVQLRLPGTGSEGSLPIMVSPFIYILFIVSPVLATCSIIFNYRGIHKFSKEQLQRALDPLPSNIRIIIIENLKVLNKKLKDQLKLE